MVSHIEPARVGRAGVVVIAHEAGLILRNLVSDDLLDGSVCVALTSVITDARVGGIGLVETLEIVDLIGGLVAEIACEAAIRDGHEVRAAHNVNLAVINLRKIAEIHPDVAGAVRERNEVPALKIVGPLRGVVPFPKAAELQVANDDVLRAIDVQSPVSQGRAAI